MVATPVTIWFGEYAGSEGVLLSVSGSGAAGVLIARVDIDGFIVRVPSAYVDPNPARLAVAS